MSDPNTDAPPDAAPVPEADEAWIEEMAHELGAPLPASTSASDPDPAPDPASADDTQEAARLADAAEARRTALLERLAMQPALDAAAPDAPDDTAVYTDPRDRATTLLEATPPDPADLDTAEALLTEADDAHRAITERRAALAQLRVQREDLREQLATQPALDPQEATAEEQSAVATAQETAAQALATDPPSEAALHTATDAIGRASAALDTAQKRIADAQARRREEKQTRLAELAQIPDLDPAEATPEEIAALAQARDAAAQALATETPAANALVTATTAIGKARTTEAEARERIAQDKAARATEKSEIAKALERTLDGATATPDEIAGEGKARAAIALLIDAEHPTHADLGEAQTQRAALATWRDGIEAAIASDRKPRHARAKAAETRRAALDMSVLADSPDAARAPLDARLDAIRTALAKLTDWAQITTWQTPEIEAQETAIAELEKDVEVLRQKLAAARTELQAALDEVAAALGALSGGALSADQMQHVTAPRDTAEAQARADLLDSAAPVAELRKIAKNIKGLDKIRASLGKRLTAMGASPPAGLLKSEADEWTRLRTAAVTAMDAVLSP